MTIDEAILILTQTSQGRNLTSLVREHEAEKLGIEALKREKDAREGFACDPGTLLPGEIEE